LFEIRVNLKKQKKNHGKKKDKKKSKLNLIFLHVNHICLILDFQIGPQTFRHAHCTLGGNVFKKVKKVPIQGSICFKFVLGILILEPLFLNGFKSMHATFL
jgi:hypothetical protein